MSWQKLSDIVKRLDLKDEPSPFQNREARMQKQHNWNSLRGWGTKFVKAIDDYLTNVDQRIDEQLNANTFKDEEVDFRHSDMLTSTFKTMRKRGDFWDDEFQLRGVNVDWFGAVGDGTTDDTQAFEQAIEVAAQYGGIVAVNNKTYLVHLVISTPNIILTGSGTIKGTIDLDALITDTNEQPNLNFKIKNVSFTSDGESTYGIGLGKARDGSIKDCKFDETICKAIEFVATPTYNQMAARINIIDCEFNSDYALYCNHDTQYFPLADVHFFNNFCKNKVANIYIVGIDGLSLSGNTLFLPGNAKRDQKKTYNLYIKHSMWITVDSSNHFFEAGLESILLDRCQNPIFDGVSIAWPGQRKPSDGIRVINGDMEGLANVMGSITDCNIIFPTKSGISVEDNCGGTIVNDNKIKSAGYSGYYYGSDDLSKVEHYGVTTEATTSNLLVTGNSSAENKNNILGQTNYYADNFDVNRNVKDKNRVFELNTNDQIVSVAGRDQINLNQPAATTVTKLIDGYDGQIVFLVAMNGNTTISTEAAYMSKSVNYNIKNHHSLELRFASGQWYEIGRN